DDVNPPPKPFPDEFVEKLQLRQAPYEIPQIYQGVRLLVYCMLAKGIEPSRSITLSAISQDGPMKLVIPVDSVTLQGSKIHTLAARKLIQDLEDGKSFLHAHPKFEGKNIGISLVKKHIIDLAIKYNIASRYTSFLAIDKREVKLVKDPLILQRRVVPQPSTNSLFGSSTTFNRNQ
ncbi:444_t:CDS:2, partial [Acaulospora morrowiae]